VPSENLTTKLTTKVERKEPFSFEVVENVEVTKGPSTIFNQQIYNLTVEIKPGYSIREIIGFLNKQDWDDKLISSPRTLEDFETGKGSVMLYYENENHILYIKISNINIRDDEEKWANSLKVKF
jgi:hypothetical protein